MVEVDRLTKQYLAVSTPAVDAVSFVCRTGEIYGLLGANGAGKTTILRMLATLLKPSGGAGCVAGCDLVKQPKEVRARIGFVSSATALYGRLKASEMIAYIGKLRGIEQRVIRERAAELFARLNVTAYADQLCGQLSTGTKQKVSFACTLIHDPSVLIFDEPTTGLDVLSARALLAIVSDCRARGKTVVFSTHTMREAEKLCDRVGIIHQGRMLAEGTVAEVRAQGGGSDLEEAFAALIAAAPPLHGHEPP